MNTRAITPIAISLLALGACSAPREGVDEKLNIFPLAYYETVEQPEGYTVDVLWPLIRAWKSGEAGGSHALPLYVWKDDGEGERFTNVLLLYWQTIGDDGEVRRDLFPFFHYVRDTDEVATRLWPLYGVREYGGEDLPNRSDQVAWPLFSWDRARDGSFSKLGLVSLWPLFALFQSEHREREHGQIPLRSSTHVVSALEDAFALARWEHVRKRSSAGDASDEDAEESDEIEDRSEFSLVQSGELFRLFHSETVEGESSRQSFVQLFRVPRVSLVAVDRDLENGASYSHVFPLWFRSTGEDEDNLLLLPLYGSFEEGSREQTWIAPPLLGIERDPETDLTGVDVLFPLIRYASAGTGEDHETHFRFLPLAWFTLREDTHVRWILPLYYDIEDEEGRYLHVVPLYGRNVEKGGKERTTFVLAPLFVRHEDDEEGTTDTHVLFPLFEQESAPDHTMSRLFPLYYYRAGEDDSHLNVLALFDRWSDESQTSTLLYPVFHRVSDPEGRSRASVLPLVDLRFFDDDALEGDEFSVLFPLSSFRSESDGDKRRWVFPVYWDFEDTEDDESLFALWPLFGKSRDGSRTTWSTLFPFFFYGADSEDDAFMNLGYLFPLGYARTEKEESRSWLFPLYYHGRDGEGTTSWVLWPLFYRERDDEHRLWHSLFYLLRSEHTDVADEFSILYALYRSRTEGQKTTRSVPFLFRYQNDGGERELRLFHLIPIRF